MRGLTLKVTGLSQIEWSRAPVVARLFLEEYPDKFGFHNPVVYVREGNDALYVYRTKTSVVVRGTG